MLTARDAIRLVEILFEPGRPFRCRASLVKGLGFAAFDRYIERRRPSLWLHGHLAHGYTRIVGSTAIHGVVGKRLLTLSL